MVICWVRCWCCHLGWRWWMCCRWEMCLRCSLGGHCCCWTQKRSTLLIQPHTTVSPRGIEALLNTLWLFLIFSIKTTVWALLAGMRNFLGKKISFLASSITNPVRGACTRSSYCFKLCTLLTAVTRSWIKFVWKHPIQTRLAVNITGWMLNWLSTHRIQSITRMACITM